MRIRNATRADAKSVAKMFSQLYNDQKRSIRTGPFGAKTLLLMAEEKGSPAGFIWANFYDYGPSAVGYIDELYVRPKFRRNGAGKQLIRSAAKQLFRLGAETVFVTTTPTSRVAQRFYRAMGFRKCDGPWFWLAPRRP